MSPEYQEKIFDTIELGSIGAHASLLYQSFVIQNFVKTGQSRSKLSSEKKILFKVT